MQAEESPEGEMSYGVYTGTESFGNAVNQSHSDQNLPNSLDPIMLFVCKHCVTVLCYDYII